MPKLKTEAVSKASQYAEGSVNKSKGLHGMKVSTTATYRLIQLLKFALSHANSILTREGWSNFCK